MQRRRGIDHCSVAVLLHLVLAQVVWAGDVGTMSPVEQEFFENRVRPILVGVCAECHGPELQKNGLRLDSREAVLKGGRNGIVVVPGKPDESTLIDYINYRTDDLQMPPSEKLADKDIIALTKWVETGAHWPRERRRVGESSDGSSFEREGLADQSKLWSFRPILEHRPPEVESKAWPRTPIDSFILAELEEAGLFPAAPADKRTLLRRVYFDLIGLPPTSDEIVAFLHDDSPTAFENVVERLLASPHYGERWGRHWLDLVRFAESTGFTQDFEIDHAWPYRDYVIRAFNDDIPYTDFVTEHVAGDLLDEPRRNAVEDFNESVIGTAFYWFGSGTPEPNDIRDEECDRIDNQIDVFSRTFLGMSVACARCHDHSHDPISLEDYYALAGFFKSTRRQYAQIDPSDQTQAIVSRLRQIKSQILDLTKSRLASRSDGPQRKWYYVFLIALAISGPALAATKARWAGKTFRGRRIAILWISTFCALLLAGFYLAVRPLQGRSTANENTIQDFLDRTSQKFARLHHSRTESMAAAQSRFVRTAVFEDFDNNSYKGWRVTGEAFGNRPSNCSDIMLAGSLDSPLPHFEGSGLAHSGLVSDKLRGTLRSDDFSIDKNFLLFRMARHSHSSGEADNSTQNGDVHLIVDGYFIDYFESVLSIDIEPGDRLAWYAIDASRWVGHRAYIEIVDDGDDSIVVDKILFADTRCIPAYEPESVAVNPNILVIEMLDDPAVTTLQDLAQRYDELFETTLHLWANDEIADSTHAKDRLEILNWLRNESLSCPDLLEAPAGASTKQQIAALLGEYHELESQIKASRVVLAATDGTALDEYALRYGDHNDPGAAVPRAFLQALADPHQNAITDGSGRLELANRLVDNSNPLLPRVMVNRIWHYHFGRGIVATPDSFGTTGESPTHPDLLDFLTSRFIESGYSVKQMHRLILSSSTYRTSSRIGDPQSEDRYPQLRLYHRSPLRRLDAEVIRDTILALGGNLDRKLYGPSATPQATSLVSSDGQPDAQGPFDENGRRSIYLQVKRQSLLPMLLAFDFPEPNTTIGRRRASNTPLQALMMMDDPFVRRHASFWADRMLAEEHPTAEARIARLYTMAFSRAPSETETSAAIDFLSEQSEQSGQPGGPECWADLCHVLMNASEFRFAD